MKISVFFLTTLTILLLISSTKSFSKESVFTIDNVEVKGLIDINFSRDKYIDKAFLNDVSEALLSSYQNLGGINHVDGDNLPDRQSIESILRQLKALLFPGYFEKNELTKKKILTVISYISNINVMLKTS